MVAIVAGAAASPFPAAAADAEVDLATITRRVKAWRSSFVNLRMVWEIRSLSTTTEKPLPAWSVSGVPKDAPVFTRQEWIWADHGLDLFQSEAFYFKGGGARGVDVFNGPENTVFRASYKRAPNGKETLNELLIRGVRTGKPTSFFDRVPMHRLYWPGTADWLPEMLSKWKWSLEGFDRIAGERCARISAANPDFTDVRWVEILWLDLKHDCLVRRCLEPPIPDRPNRRRGSDFIVDEFQRLPNGIWFPKRGRMQLFTKPYENQLWVVTKVSVNGSIDLKRFEVPKPAIGTVVDDKGRVYTYGGSNARRRKPGETGSATTPGSAHDPSRNATPPTSGWLWWLGGLLLASALFLAAGFWFRHRSQEGRRTWLLVVAFLAGAAGSPSVAAAADAKVDLATISRRVKAWRSSFVNLRVVWELRILPTETKQSLPKWTPPADWKNARLFSRMEWIWADHGLDLLQVRTFDREGGGGRTVEVFNGPKSVVFRGFYKHPRGGPEEFADLIIRNVATGKPISAKGRVPLRGVYWPGLASWLPDVLSKCKWTLEGTEDIGGDTCARIVGAHPECLGYSTVPVLWIDLKHDCLVRRFLERRSDADRSTWTDSIVDEFQRLPNGIWFPKRGRMQLQAHRENQLWEVTEIALNRSLDQSRFSPPAPAKGTIVDDGTRVYRHGVSVASPQKAGSATKIGETGPSNSPARSAAPPTSTWLWWSAGLAVGSLLFLSCGIWFWHKRSEE